MTIHEYAHQLQDKISSVPWNTSALDLVSTSKALHQLHESLDALKQFVRRYSFASIEEEIAFFKETKPVLISQLVYCKIVFKVQLHESYAPATDSEFYDAYLQKFECFLRKHQPFIQYCLSGSTRHDRLYFTRSGSVLKKINDDENFTTGYDERLGKFMAFQRARDYLQARMNNDNGAGISPAQGLSWTESKVSLIELAYALYASGAFDNGKVTVKQIIAMFERFTGLDLANYSRIFADIRLRKTGPRHFLDRLSQQYIQYIESLE